MKLAYYWNKKHWLPVEYLGESRVAGKVRIRLFRRKTPLLVLAKQVRFSEEVPA